jgi:hypothetical protein
VGNPFVVSRSPCLASPKAASRRPRSKSLARSATTSGRCAPCSDRSGPSSPAPRRDSPDRGCYSRAPPPSGAAPPPAPWSRRSSPPHRATVRASLPSRPPTFTSCATRASLAHRRPALQRLPRVDAKGLSTRTAGSSFVRPGAMRSSFRPADTYLPG